MTAKVWLLLRLGMLEVLERLLVELQVLVERILELRQLHQAQLCEIDRLHLALVSHNADFVSEK